MLRVIRNILGKTNNISRSAYVWNSINAIMSACQCPVILMVITRTNGVYDAGVFSIAFAVASLMLYVGQYGIRRFQASDIEEKYSFSEYHGMRIVTCIIMALACVAYCFYGLIFSSYSYEKFMIVLLVCMLKCIQGYADVIHGRMQQKGRLDVATKASATRYALEVITYIVMLILTHDLLAATVACIMVSLAVLMLTSVNAARDYCSFRPSFENSKMKQLMIEGFPLFVSLFLNMYISNAPKYAIDACLTEEIQAIYNLIFMPAFMVGLLANFIFNPILTSYAKVWIEKKYDKFNKLIIKQCIIVAGLTAAGLAVAFTIGIPLLSIIFGVDLSAYKYELCVVMAGGGMLAYSTFFSTIITIMRMQRSLLVCYAVVALAAKLLSTVLVTSYGIMGAAVMYAVLMTVLTLMLLIIMICKIRKEKGAHSA